MSYQYETLEVHPWAKDPAVLQVKLNRPQKKNAMNKKFWEEMRSCFEKISLDPDVRCVVLSANGKLFSSGLDLSDSSLLASDVEDPARRSYLLRRQILMMQDSFSFIEQCKQPVIAAIHSACIGGGVDLVSACCIRYCSKDAYFSIKEADVGLAADVGTLQRMPKIVGNEGLVRELAYTARNFPAAEALQRGFVTRVFDSADILLEESLKVASEIAKKSPVAVIGSKRFLNYSRDHSVADGLEYAATWNMAMLNTEDLPLAMQASLQKKPASFSKL